MLLAAETVVRSLHLIGAAVWAGGMVMLALAVGAARRTVAEHERIALFRALGRRFAIAGGIAMLVLIATGTDMAADRLGSVGDLFDTDYGERLLAKLVLVVVVIALTLFHTLVQGPALSELRQEAVAYPDDKDLRREIRSKAAQAGIVSALNLVATLGGPGAGGPPRDRLSRLDRIATLERSMKTDIHPEYVEAHVRCTCGNEFTTRSTKPELHVEICSECHPFYTGKQKLVDTGGRVERFQRRAAKRKGSG